MVLIKKVSLHLGVKVCLLHTFRMTSVKVNVIDVTNCHHTCNASSLYRTVKIERKHSRPKRLTHFTGTSDK